MKMEGLNKRESVQVKEEEKTFDESNPEVSGGVSKDYGNKEAMDQADKIRAEALKEKIVNDSDSQAKNESTPTTEAIPLDVSLIKNKITELQGKKKSIFDFGRTQDSIDLLNTALKKINNPSDKSFARDYMAALGVDDDFAMEYARDIGAGKLVYPDVETRTIMTSRKNSAKNYFGE